MSSITKVLSLLCCACTCLSARAETVVLENAVGLKWELQRQPQGWTLGTISLHGKLIERPITDGLWAFAAIAEPKCVGWRG